MTCIPKEILVAMERSSYFFCDLNEQIMLT